MVVHAAASMPAASNSLAPAGRGAEEALTASRCDASQTAINLPIYISPIAVIYNVDGVSDLKLDATTLASVFAGKITKWNDPAIAALNDGTTLPDLTITAVHRADDSGTTENFTEYLNANSPDVWSSEPDGVWPLEGGEGASGTSGVIDAVTNGTGTIGYADASRAGDLGVAKIKVGEEFVEYSAEAAAAIVDESPEEEGRSEGDIAIELDLDGGTRVEATTGIPFFDHMLAQLGRHGGFDLVVRATGDLEIDALDGLEGAVALADVVERESRHGWGSRCWIFVKGRQSASSTRLAAPTRPAWRPSPAATTGTSR